MATRHAFELSVIERARPVASQLIQIDELRADTIRAVHFVPGRHLLQTLGQQALILPVEEQAKERTGKYHAAAPDMK